MSHSGLLFKLKFIGVGGSVLSIYTDFLSNCRQRVVVDGTASEWIPIISGMPKSNVGPLLCILYTSKIFELFENRLFSYSDDSTLLAVRKPADRPAGAVPLNRDLARIQKWCNYWCLIQNPNKTKALVISRSRTVSPPLCDLVLSGVSL